MVAIGYYPSILGEDESDIESYTRELLKRREKIGKKIIHTIKTISPTYRRKETFRKEKAQKRWEQYLYSIYGVEATAELNHRKFEIESAEREAEREERVHQIEIERKEQEERNEAFFKEELYENQQLRFPEVEKKFNDVLSTAEYFKQNAEQNTPGISQGEILTDDGEKVTVYDLTGLKFKTLAHNTLYRILDDHKYLPAVKNLQDIDTIGMPHREMDSIAATALYVDPSLWLTMHDEEYTFRFGGKRPILGGRHDYLCTTYIDSDYNLFWLGGELSIRVPPIMYAFSHINNGDLLGVAPRDASTFSTRRDSRLTQQDPDALLNSIVDVYGYNEVILSRYETETGRPIMPDYIMINNNAPEHIQKAALRAASFFHVPLMKVHSYIYEQEQRLRKGSATETVRSFQKTVENQGESDVNL
ncbi:MAG: hypothetical protein LBQ02_02535 [Candidatus Nomurabacteria bacterium]|jgi:hypothetical protein|nr:hypothetical protein [Candidatus Nomurabacteria bacterium]